MNAPPTIDELFSVGGSIARELPGFEPRPGQLEMARAVEAGFNSGSHVLVEAGTGVGKSFAYLVPALRSGKRVVISTSTIALQQQLFRKDIPMVARALGLEPRVVLLKGRSNYLCREKWERARGDLALFERPEISKLRRWANETVTGDRSDVPFRLDALLWERFDADGDDCIGEACTHFDDCFYYRRRRDAEAADIIVVNHAIFFIDAISGGLLPAYDYAILDEAHTCEDIAMNVLTASLSRRSIDRTFRRLRRYFTLPTSLTAQIDERYRELGETLAGSGNELLRLEERPEVASDLDRLRDALYHLENWIADNGASALTRPPRGDLEREMRIAGAVKSLAAQAEVVDRLLAVDEDSIRWAQSSAHGSELHCTPFDAAPILRDLLFARTPCLLTSATLALGGDFSYVRARLGIDSADELVAASPFDYREQARLFVAPADLEPDDPDFVVRAYALLEEALTYSRGRAFVLCTSFRRAAEFGERLCASGQHPVEVQRARGGLDRDGLLRWFTDTPGAVLVGTRTFWEGIDMPGERLSCVVIDRIPFAQPDHPVLEARVQALRERGEDAFARLQIPAATMLLKQGFGRLIRSRRDRGAVLLLDGRLQGKGYGKRMIAALPPATRIAHLDELQEFFQT
ncbi:MAG: hypothetical protein HKL92_04110 [Candidatus Eremiobacteraeota bacterium]|nr:helicase C-terminal domain-containing protein [Candidatus Eremiobacteraeota bacterium]NNM92505.1 hypothetical protein [Candidatus Eremiobacteraeota bacterium]